MNNGQPPCDELLALLGDEQPALTRLLTAPTLQNLSLLRLVEMFSCRTIYAKSFLKSLMVFWHDEAGLDPRGPP